MKNRSVDVLVIGAGSAGLNAIRELEGAGADWLLVEADRYGTTCARVGCMPSKLLVAAADAATAVRSARSFGIQPGDVVIDGDAVFERVRRERDRFVQGVVQDAESLPETRRMIGAACFDGENTVVVGDELRVTAKAIVIAAGGTPSMPTVFNPIRDRVLTSDSVFELQRIPATVAVVGTGAIGLELGQALQYLGARVSFYSHGSTLGSLSDPRLQNYMRDTFSAELDLHLDCHIDETAIDKGGLRLRWRDSNDGKHTDVFDEILVATGRESNLSTLNLQAAGLKLNGNGRPEWDPQTTQCGDRPIFLAGDVNGHKALLHEAADEGRIAGQNAMLYPDVTAHVRRTPLSIVFTDPQMAIAGARHASIDENGVEIAEFSYENQGRARVIDKATGLVRLYAERRSCVLVGAEMFGPRIEHLAHLLAWSVDMRLPVQRLLQMPFYHPVLEEGLRTGLQRLAKQLKVAGDCRCEDRAAAVGM